MSVASRPSGTGRKRHEPYLPDDVRFNLHVDKSEEWGGCHIWTGATAGGGYGATSFEGWQQPAHRVSWKLFKGPIPKGLWVLHRCDVRACVNPEHLFLGTRQDNMDDMKAKERQSRKSSFGRRKLTIEDVRDIRRRLANFESQAWIANIYGVGQTAISFIKIGRTWKGIE